MALRSLAVLLTITATACAAESDGATNDDNLVVTSETVPPQLQCVAHNFTGTPKKTDHGWVLDVGNGHDLVWDDGQTKTVDQKLEHADLEDMTSMAYPAPGTEIAPVNDPSVDPGRIRVDDLFKATYGKNESEVEAQLVRIDWLGGQKVRVHKKVAPALTKVVARLTAAVAADSSLKPFLVGELGGTMNWRVIAGTTRLSAHSFATAIDIVTAQTNYWQWDHGAGWRNKIPQAIVDAFEAEGFIWGGRWVHYDTMHFEYRPDMFDPACKPSTP